MPGETLFETSRARVLRLEEDDGDATQALFERCSDFFALVFGHPPGQAETQSHFTGLPEGRTYDDKFVAGIFVGDEMAGTLDAIRDHPHPGGWALGLLLLDPAHRGNGLGREVYEGFERWAAGFGAREIRIVVQQQNRRARAFWDGLGFAVERTENRRQGVLDSVCHIMVGRLDPRRAG